MILCDFDSSGKKVPLSQEEYRVLAKWDRLGRYGDKTENLDVMTTALGQGYVIPVLKENHDRVKEEVRRMRRVIDRRKRRLFLVLQRKGLPPRHNVVRDSGTSFPPHWWRIAAASN